MADTAPRDESRSQQAASPPVIPAPKGGGAIRGLGEKFAAAPVTGTGSMTVPIAVSDGRSGFGPQLALSYDSASGNGPFGFGWNLSLPSITRKTEQGLPRYCDADESDVFILSGVEDLVPVPTPAGISNPPGYTIQRYRPRIDTLFARIERWTADDGEIHWRSITRDNITTIYGQDDESRILDPSDDRSVAPPTFSWLICQTYDDRGNAIVYEYVREDSQGVAVSQPDEQNRTARGRQANRYPKRIKYGNTIPRRSADFADTAWLFEVVFDYGEGHLELQSPDADDRQTVRAHLNGPDPWPVRPDAFSTCRPGFEVRTYRLCERVLMFHHFKTELGIDDYLVRGTEFGYDRTAAASFLTSVTQSGYVARPGPANQSTLFLQRSFPSLEFDYSKAVLSGVLKEVAAESVENLPIGLDGTRYRWVDLDGEGASGVLSELEGASYYKRNLGNARFAPVEVVRSTPAASSGSPPTQLLDLSGDGQLDVVAFAETTPGYYERTTEEGWEPFTAFRELPRIDWSNPNLRFVDLTGNGHADVLITDDDALVWHGSLGEDGFAPAERSVYASDEERGPRLVFADERESVYLADFSGDGLSDLVRIRNGEISYWPNLGYGRFGARVTMGNSPRFDRPEAFDQRQVRLVDIDGSGTTDIIYLERGQATVYRNLSGNTWSEGELLTGLPPVDDFSQVLAIDLLGTGTACLVWSSPLSADATSPMRYVDLMAGGKPHLLVGARNNLGAETRITYAASTKFSLADRAAGRPWVTRLPFPVHVVERVETRDLISRNVFVSRYCYHHGYFDGVEREFRGFGMVEQWDTEQWETLVASGDSPSAGNIDAASYVPPVYTRTWFHTGIYDRSDRVSSFFAGTANGQARGEYYREPAWRDDDAEARKRLLDDTVVPPGLSVDEEREACRALKGEMLRREVYALDGTATQDYPYGHPYTVVEQNFSVRVLSRRGSNRHAVFSINPCEAIEYHYERHPSDPRTTHALTLEVDDWGNVLKSAAVAYGRTVVDPDLGTADQRTQSTTLLTYTENAHTLNIDALDAYRTPVACETRTYELTGYVPSQGSGRFHASDLVRPNANSTASELVHIFDGERDYVETPTGGRERRLIEHLRIYYRPDDLGASQGDPLTLLPLGDLQPLALSGETYTLAFTSLLARSAFVDSGKLSAADLDVALADEGRYVHTENDSHWWAPSGRVFYSAGSNDSAATELAEANAHFFRPRRYRDPFDIPAARSDTIVAYDAYDLLARDTRDALGNRVTAGERDTQGNITVEGNDYRVLQPWLVMDSNGNRTAAAFDALGTLVASAVMGKPRPAPAEGDDLSGFEADLPQAEIERSVANPSSDPTLLLGRATTRVVYDLFAFHRTSRDSHPQPCVAYAITRETHAHDSVPAGGLKVQRTFTYSDGFGREIQKKRQAEPGPVPRRDSAGGIVVDADGRPQMTSTELDPRWVGSGWVVFNNKGHAVRLYEPFFTDRHQFEFDARIGVSPVLFFDALDRAALTLHPDATYEKRIFGTWRETSYDVNDTVSLDPRTDPDVAALTRMFFSSQDPGWKTWLQERIDPRNPPADSQGQNPEQDAAVRTLAHAATPGVLHLDPLGREFLTIADAGPDPANAPQRYATRVVLDISGRQRSVFDALGRELLRSVFDLRGNRIAQTSIDAGDRYVLHDAAGNPIRTWDGRGHVFRTVYDRLRRRAEMFVQQGTAGEQLVECIVYGDTHPQAEALNLRGRVFLQTDGAGVVTSGGRNPITARDEAYDFKGNLLRSTRRLARQYTNVFDWSSAAAPLRAMSLDLAAIETALAPLLEDDVFMSSTVYDALDRPTALGTPDGSAVMPSYNEAGLVEEISAAVGAAAPVVFVRDIDYNAKGQRTRIAYGNDSITELTYDTRTFRLTALTTIRSGFSANERVVQDLSYTFDPAGNITHVGDAADIQNVVFFNNRRVEPSADYRYDALYRLTRAAGREHLGLTAGQANEPRQTDHDDGWRTNLPHPSDGNAVGRYSQEYVYDAVGNLLRMMHRGTDPQHPGWTRAYVYEGELTTPAQRRSNRLIRTQPAGPNEGGRLDYAFDAHGNISLMPNLPVMGWDHKDQLHATSQQVVATGTPETTYYTYDSRGLRVRKITEGAAAPGAMARRRYERVYVGGFEVYREYDTQGRISLARETLHVMDGEQRVAIVDTRTIDTAGTDPYARQLVRYQFGDHLDSAVLELDDVGEVISYEEYYPFGSTSYQAVRSATVARKRYGYTARERDEETGLCRHGVRYYAPWLGRWLSPDPSGLDAGINVFEYAHGNPVRFADVSGLKPAQPPVTAKKNADTSRDAGVGSSHRPGVSPDAGTPGARDGGTASARPDAGPPDTRKELHVLFYHVAKPGSPELKAIAKEPTTGRWNRTQYIATFADIVSTLEELSKTYRITEIGLLVHGDKPGAFSIDAATFTATTLPKSDIAKIEKILDPQGKVLLFGCIAGALEPGTDLLTNLSVALPGRDIVGFGGMNEAELDPTTGHKEGGYFSDKVFDPKISTYGPWAGSDAGYLSMRTAMDVNSMRRYAPKIADQLKQLADEKASPAKIVRDGKVVKWPIDESPPPAPVSGPTKKRKK